MENDYDVLILGAGLSGIGMASYLQKDCPQKSFAILERRASIGGTWDLFRYPGVRSDSDMTTFGYKLYPWNDSRIFAEGSDILSYIREMAQEFAIEDKIKFGLKILHTAWSTAKQRWTVHTLDEASGTERAFTCQFLIGAVGYYNHDQGHRPHFPGSEAFAGQIVHRQEWPQDLDYRGKKVVIIGSGATAITLLPAMAEDAGSVTMLQRSPSYLLSLPAVDFMMKPLSRIFPETWVYGFSRARNTWVTRALYKTSRRYPKTMRRLLLSLVRRKLGRDFDMSHFTPRYMPWDERMCMMPNGDFLDALRDGKASVVTDHIERFAETGIRLQSGTELEADIIITATGLELQRFGGIKMTVDGVQRPISDGMMYKAALMQDTPNFAVILGYINISWTMKAELVAEYVCRVINEMDKRGVAVVTPRAPEDEALDENILDAMQSGYVKRTPDLMPRQGRRLPWRVTHHLETDRVMYAKPVADETGLEWQT